MAMDGQESQARSAAGEGMAAKPPTPSASPSPQPLPHQGGGAKACTSPLVGEVRWAGSPSGLMAMDGQESQARSAAGEGMAAKPPTASASPSPQPLPHQGEGLKSTLLNRVDSAVPVTCRKSLS